MSIMRSTAFLLTAALAFGQGVPPRGDASVYAARGVAGQVTFAADYLVRSIPVPGGVLVSKGYLVVDLAVFGPPHINLSPAYFSLRLNGSKAALLAQQPFIVANSFDYRRADPGETGDGLTLGASTGNASIILGPPQNPPNGKQVPEPNARNSPPPRRVPETPNPYIVVKAQPNETPHKQVEKAALPSGDVDAPISGALFFAYTGKPESLKTVELLYDGPAGKVTLKLR